MAQRIPRVVDGALHVPGSSDGTGIPVGSPLWIAWLRSPATRSFSFRGSSGHYTARKEPRARGGEYWVAYRKRDGELRKCYLGKAENLTPDKLDDAAAALVGEGKPSGGRLVSEVTAGGVGSARDANAEIGAPNPDDHAGERSYWGSRDDPLLTTKLSTPSVRSSLVPRRCLTERLQAALPEARLTLISAPAGFGKTTLLGAWIGAFSGDRSAVWLSLDRGDNDPARFWRYFVAAVDRLQPGAGDVASALLGSPRAPPIEAVLTVLLNGLAGLDECCKVLMPTPP